MVISEKIKYHRTKVMDLTQKELAGELGISEATLKKWESGEFTPNVNNLIMLSLICNVSIEYLINEDHPEELSLIGLGEKEYSILDNLIVYFRKKNLSDGVNNE